MKKKHTCFVISPIGPEGSEVREDANNFLELLVEPALQRYDFEVTRADRIPHPSAITSDIVRLVQESDLCIIDLTTNNPNVFYECGRRHETGKPFIQLIKKGMEQSLPFDVSGIRTISYDLSSPRSTNDSQKKLQDFVDSLLANGFQQTTTGDSLSSVAQAVERIERKISALMIGGASTGQVRTSVIDDADDEEESILSLRMLPPKVGYLRLMQRGNVDEALKLVPKLKKALKPGEYIAALGLPASMGDRRAFELFDTAFREAIADKNVLGSDSGELIPASAQVLLNYFENTGDLDTGKSYFEDMLGKVLTSDHISNEGKANFANKLGMVSWSAGDVETSIRATKMAFDLFPDPSFAYNLCLCYERGNMDDELNSMLMKLSTLPNLDNDHRKLLRKHGITSSAS